MVRQAVLSDKRDAHQQPSLWIVQRSPRIVQRSPWIVITGLDPVTCSRTGGQKSPGQARS